MNPPFILGRSDFPNPEIPRDRFHRTSSLQRAMLSTSSKLLRFSVEIINSLGVWVIDTDTGVVSCFLQVGEFEAHLVLCFTTLPHDPHCVRKDTILYGSSP